VTRPKFALFRLVIFLTVANYVFSAPALAQEASTRPVLKQGVVAESIIKNQEGDKAGIQPGDVLLAWSRGDTHGEIHSPFDLAFIRIEQASRGPVKLTGFRGSKKRTWLLGSDQWGVWTYPNFQGELLAIYRQGQELARAGKLDDVLEQWRKSAAIADTTDIPWIHPWLLSRAARMYGERRKGNDDLFRQDDLYRQAIEQANRAEPGVRADLLRQRGDICLRRGDFVHMEEYYEERLLELKKLGDKPIAIADGLLSLASVTYRRGNLLKAEQYAQEALALSQAEAPRSMETILVLQSLGSVLIDQGELAAAERYYQQALDNLQRYFPNSARLEYVLAGLGVLSHRRGELAKAQVYYRRALAVAERTGRDSPTVADALGNLAECLTDQGDAAAAETYALRALAIWQGVMPGSLPLASSLRNLGQIARVRGDLTKANEYYQQALAIAERVAPLSWETQRFLIGLGYVARDRGDFDLADTYFRKALDIMEKSEPDSLIHAETLADLADVLYRQKKLDVATTTYQQALAGLENKVDRWSALDEEQSHYRAYRSSYYKEYVDLLVQQGKAELAFETVEGYRARTLFEMLSESQIDIRQGVDPSLLARERELRQVLTAKSQYRIRLLGEKHSDEEVNNLNQEITNLRDHYEQSEAEIRTSSPIFAALTQPQPLTTKQIQQLLDPETVLLEYSLGEQRSFVWLVTDSSLTVYELPKRSEIESLARRLYRAWIARTHRVSTNLDAEQANWAKADASSRGLAANLSRLVLDPIADLVEGKRLLIVTDGALQYVPFSALPTRKNPNEPLIVEHEIVNLPSASVLAEIRRASADRPRASREVAVLADPVFDPDDERVESAVSKLTPRPSFIRSSQTVSRSASDVGLIGKRGFGLDRLTYSRDEAQAILAVAPHAKSFEALDFQANRATALSPELAQYRIVHFATHGFLDSKRPELSGLVLSLVNRQGKPTDGFLGLEDVYNMKLPVDMVVLSGCQTGLGEEISGEGLIGLTRGFMYAGASRVVASLWSVDDFTTSQLMAKFYRAMERDNMPPAAALRKAQIEMWKHRGWQAPYYWAAFQLQGEWK
jgi:CHAT domain-containing protein/Tfp pilus assembly protein PilF